MQIKKIAAICKKKKQVILYNKVNEDGEPIQQYIGDGSAIYPVYGLPILDEESILTIFDVQKKKRDGWIVKHTAPPAVVNLEDVDHGERRVDPGNITIGYGGMELLPVTTRRGLALIDTMYLAPVGDVMDALDIYERTAPDGSPYIVAKVGFMLQSVILPVQAINQAFTDRLEEIAEHCKVALIAQADKDRMEEQQ